MQIIGVILAIIVISLFIYYFRWSKTEVTVLDTEEGQKVTVLVKGNYSPNVIKAKVGKPLTVTFDRQEDSACSKKVIFDGFGVSAELVDFGTTDVSFTPERKGEFVFSCEMGMYQGKLIVD